jgi:LacI family transcriptional regulator
MKNAQTTIRDLAIKLDISISTVSRALRNAPDVNPQTKEAVLELARKLKYEPNRVAQSLRIKKTNTLGVIVPEINLHFFSSVISGIQEYCSQHNYNIMICQSMESAQTEKTNVHMLSANRVDGIVMSLSRQTKRLDHIEQLIEKKIPIVLFDRVAEDIDVSKVVVDDHDGALHAVDYMIKTGCKRIAFIGGPPNLYISSQRLKGYEDALKANAIDLDESLIIHCKNLQDDATDAVKQLLDLPIKPDGIFCFIDPIAIAAIEILKERNIAIPDEISVVGFTNEPVSQYIHPSLTTVSQPAYEMGHSAAALFIEQMENKGTFTPVTKVLKTKLVLRRSTRMLMASIPVLLNGLIDSAFAANTL